MCMTTKGERPSNHHFAPVKDSHTINVDITYADGVSEDEKGALAKRAIQAVGGRQRVFTSLSEGLKFGGTPGSAVEELRAELTKLIQETDVIKIHFNAWGGSQTEECDFE